MADYDGFPIVRWAPMSVDEQDRRIAAFFAEAADLPAPVAFHESLETESDPLPEGVTSLVWAQARRNIRRRMQELGL